MNRQSPVTTSPPQTISASTPAGTLRATQPTIAEPLLQGRQHRILTIEQPESPKTLQNKVSSQTLNNQSNAAASIILGGSPHQAREPRNILSGRVQSSQANYLPVNASQSKSNLNTTLFIKSPIEVVTTTTKISPVGNMNKPVLLRKMVKTQSQGGPNGGINRSRQARMTTLEGNPRKQNGSIDLLTQFNTIDNYKAIILSSQKGFLKNSSGGAVKRLSDFMASNNVGQQVTSPQISRNPGALSNKQELLTAFQNCQLQPPSTTYQSSQYFGKMPQRAASRAGTEMRRRNSTVIGHYTNLDGDNVTQFRSQRRFSTTQTNQAFNAQDMQVPQQLSNRINELEQENAALRAQLRQYVQTEQHLLVQAATDDILQTRQDGSTTPELQLSSVEDEFLQASKIKNPQATLPQSKKDSGEFLSKVRDAMSVHNLYQELFVSDLRKQNDEQLKHIQELQKKVSELEEMHKNVIQENAIIKNKIGLYRKVAADQAANDISDNQTGPGIIKFKEPESKQIYMQNLTQQEIQTTVSKLKPSAAQHLLSSPLSNAEEKKIKESFVTSSFPLLEIVLARTIPDLFKATRIVCQRYMKTEHCDFLLMNKELIHSLQANSDGLSIEQKRVAQYTFHKLCFKDENKFVPGFNFMRDVERGFIKYGRKFMVWPVKMSENRLMLIQLHRPQAEESTLFDKFKDFPCMEAIGQAFTNAYYTIRLNGISTRSQKRAFEVLDTCKNLLCERTHVSLAKALSKVMPTLFKFQACGVMYVDPVSKDLYSIQHLRCDVIDRAKHDPAVALANKIKDFDNIVRYPRDTGCTGQAISNHQIVFFNKGHTSPVFSNDIDNVCGITQIDSLLICPIFDSENELLGMIQLINKQGGEVISEVDRDELTSLEPILAGLIQTVNEIREIKNIGFAVQLGMIETKDSLMGKFEQVEGEMLLPIATGVKQLDKLIQELIDHKRKGLYRDKALGVEILSTIRESAQGVDITRYSTNGEKSTGHKPVPTKDDSKPGNNIK